VGKDIRIGLYIFTFTFMSSLPCPHTFAMPSLHLLIFSSFLFLHIFDVNLRPKYFKNNHSPITWNGIWQFNSGSKHVIEASLSELHISETRPSPFFTLFRFRVLYWTQTEEQKTGEAWERGYLRTALNSTCDLLLVNTDYITEQWIFVWIVKIRTSKFA